MYADGEIIPALRVSLDPVLQGEGVLRGQVHSVFRRAVNIAVEGLPGGLLTVLGPESPLVPDGITVSDQDLAFLTEFDIGTEVEVRHKTLRFSGHTAAISWESIQNELLFVPRLRPDPEVRRESCRILNEILYGESESGFDRMVPAVRERAMGLLENYCRAARAGDVPGAVRAVDSGVGLGMGLTPSFDDALTGCIAVLWAESFKCPVGLWLSEHAADRTTAVSRKYLLCAAQGRFSELLSRAVTASLTGDGLHEAARELYAVGGTSGRDMLTGLGIALN